MKPHFPKVHSCTVNHPIEIFSGLIMDCGKQIGQGEVVFDPTEQNSPQERQEITCSDCRTAARQIEHQPGHEFYEYGMVDFMELRNWLQSRGRGEGDAA